MIEKISDLVQRYRFLGWPLLSVLFSILLLIFVIAPQMVAYFNTVQLIKDTNVRAQTLDTKAKNLAAININDFQSNLSLVLSVLPENKDIPAAIGQVQNIVNSSGLQLSSINFAGGAGATDTASSGSQSYAIEIDVTGSKSALETFFDKVKLGPMIMKINGLQLTNSQNNIINATLEILAYYQSPPAVLGDVEKPIEGLTSDQINLLATIQKQVPPNTINSSSVNLPPRGRSNPF